MSLFGEVQPPRGRGAEGYDVSPFRKYLRPAITALMLVVVLMIFFLTTSPQSRGSAPDMLALRSCFPAASVGPPRFRSRQAGFSIARCAARLSSSQRTYRP
jgi:hypothetical protein